MSTDFSSNSTIASAVPIHLGESSQFIQLFSSDDILETTLSAFALSNRPIASNACRQHFRSATFASCVRDPCSPLHLPKNTQCTSLEPMSLAGKCLLLCPLFFRLALSNSVLTLRTALRNAKFCIVQLLLSALTTCLRWAYQVRALQTERTLLDIQLVYLLCTGNSRLCRGFESFQYCQIKMDGQLVHNVILPS